MEKFFREAQKGIASATGSPIYRKKMGIPPQYYFVCAHCRAELGPANITMNILHGTKKVQLLKEAGKFLRQCSACSLWVCPNCYNSETGKCIQCSPPAQTPTAESTLATQTPKFCSNCGSPLDPGAKFCSNCGTPI